LQPFHNYFTEFENELFPPSILELLKNLIREGFGVGDEGIHLILSYLSLLITANAIVDCSDFDN